MLRTTLLSLSALSLAALGAASASAGSYGAKDNYGGIVNDAYQQAGYYCHYHYKYKTVKYIKGYDYYGNPIYGYRKVRVKWCHKHYNNY
jgi:hypothetical protein